MNFLRLFFWAMGIIMAVPAGAVFPEVSSDGQNELLRELEASYEAGDHDLVIEDSNIALEKSPGAFVYHLRGKAYFAKGQYDLAIADFKRAMDLEPQNAIIISNISMAYERKRYLKEAIRYAQDAVELAPKDPQFRVSLGDLYFGMGDYGQALAAYQTAAEIAPGTAAAYEGLGNTYMKQGELNQAIQAYSRAIEADPSNPERSRIIAARKRAYAEKFSSADPA